MLIKLIFIITILFALFKSSWTYAIRSQGHQISYQMLDSANKHALVYRFYVSFDIAIINSDYLEFYFPTSVRNVDPSYPKLRIVEYGDHTQYPNYGLDFFNLDQSKFQDCLSGGTNQIFYYKVPFNLAKSKLYVIELVPEATLALPPATAYTLDTVGLKAVSYPQQGNYIIYAHSVNIATLNYDQPSYIMQLYTTINRKSPLTFEIYLGDVSSLSDIAQQNGGFVMVQLEQTSGMQVTIESCSISTCYISTNKLLLIIPFSGTNSQVLGTFTLNSAGGLKVNYPMNSYLYSKYPVFYKSISPNPYILGFVLAKSNHAQSNSQSLVYKNVLYHWRLPKDSNNEIALFVSSPTKQVYNKFTIQFQTDTNLSVNDLSKEFLSLWINLNLNFNILQGSFVTNFTPISANKNVICRIKSGLVVCTNIKELLVNVIYEISFKVIVFDSTTFKLQGINIYYNSDLVSESIAQVPTNILNAITLNFATNTDTTKSGSNQSWSPYLQDLQVISVQDVGTNNANTIAQRAFYSATSNQGGGIFISRGVESIAFFLTINPTTLCNGSCVGINKIIKMTMIANNNFFKFTAADTSGIYLAGESSVSTTHSFSGLDCSAFPTTGCKDGSASQQLDSNNYVINGKQVDTTYNTVKYTLRCGASGQPVLPSQECSQMFQGMENTLGTYQNGFGGIFYIKQVDLSNSYIPSRVVADDQSPDFLITFSLEDPMNMSSSQTITLRTLINAYAISYHAADNVQFKSSFVNFSYDSQGLYNPTLFRLRVTNPKDNKRIIIFLDNSVELTSFIDESQATYSCQVITQSDTLANYDQTSCLGFKGQGQYAYSNYNFNNIVVVNTNLSGVSYLDILIPLSPLVMFGVNPTFLHVGYGILVDSFEKGLQSLAIQELISLRGISSKGPSLQTSISTYFSNTALVNEDLTGMQKLYSYAGPQQTITFTAAISANTKMILTDTTNTMNYFQFNNDSTYSGAGMIITSILQDPFQGQVDLSAASGTFPDQTGKCFKFSYFTSRSGEDYSNPTNSFKYVKRFSVFCPFDYTAVAPAVSPITIFNTFNTQSSQYQFSLPIETADKSVLSIAVSEKEGRNVAQQNIPIISNDVLTDTNAITSPVSGTNVNVNYAFPLNFQFTNFNYVISIYQTLVIEITIDNNLFQGNYKFLSVDVSINTQKQSSSFTLTTNVLKITIPQSQSLKGQALSQIDISTLFMRTNQVSTLGAANISFQCKIYFQLSYYPRTTSEILVIRKANPSISLTYAAISLMSVDIDRPAFERGMEGSRDKFQFSFMFSNSNLNKVNIELVESIQIDLGFLRNPNKSQDLCLFYTDNTYTNVDHSVSIFANQFKFNSVRPYSQKIYLQCYGVEVYNSGNAATYSVKYFNSEAVDILASTNRIQELLLAQWSRPLPRNGLSIFQLGIEQNEAGLNALNIIINQNPANLPLFPLGEFIVYFPREIDLNEFMYTISKTSTTLYIPEKHALRIKVQSPDLVAQSNQYYMSIFPIQVTKQLINQSPNRFIYVEYIDIDSKTVIDYSYINFLSINFGAFTEKQPSRIEISQAYYNLGMQRAIDTINIKFSVRNFFSANGQTFRFVIYTRVGSQYNSRSLSLQSEFNEQNSFSILFQNVDVNPNSEISTTIKSITALKSQLKDLVYIPIYICLYQNQNLIAMTYHNGANLVGLNLLSDSSVYKQQFYTFLSDSEGDQIYAVPLYNNIISMKQELIIRELNGQSFQVRNPLVNIQQLDSVRSYSDIFIFKQENSSQQILKYLYLVPNQDVSYYFAYNEVNQVNEVGVMMYFMNNIYKPCSVESEFGQYYVKQGQTGLTIRIFLDEYCKIIDSTFDYSLVTITPIISGTLGTIVDTTPLKLTANRVLIYKINVSATIPTNTLFNIQYTTSNLPNIKLLDTNILAYPSDSNSLSLSSVKLGSYAGKIEVDIVCNENKLIFYEINLYENKSKLLSDSDLTARVQNGAIKQANQNQIVGKQSTNLIGSIQCNPKSQSMMQNTFYIENLRPSTKYSIKFYIESSPASSILDSSTTKGTANPLLYLQLQIKEQAKLLTNTNPNLIRSQFLCYISYYLSIPYYLLRLSEQPDVSCQQYLDTKTTPFAQLNSYPDSNSCQLISQDSLWHTSDDDEYFNFQFYPIEYGNDTSIFVEIDYTQNSNLYLTSLTNLFTGNKQIIQMLNNINTAEFINTCPEYVTLNQIQNYGNTIEPKVKVVKNSCSKNLRCKFYIQQEQGSSILYFVISAIELEKTVVDSLTVSQFRANNLNFLQRYVYPIDTSGVAQFNFTIAEADTNYYAYWFITDLTIQDYAYQYPGVYNETIIFITTYDATNLILFIVLPIVGVIVISGAYYLIKYLRNRKKVGVEDKKRIQDAESNDEDIEQIKEIENNRVDNVLEDLQTDNRVGQLFEKEKNFKCSQITSVQGKVNAGSNKKAVISSKLVSQHYDGNLEEVEEVVLL